MTDQLRDLLEQAVPDDTPAIDPHALTDAARRGRNRSRAAVVGVAALAVAIGTVAVAALDWEGDGRGHVADGGSSAPYDAPPCPATLPELADATTSVDSLEELASVRLCPDLTPPGLTVETPTPSEQTAILAGMDALVGDLTSFATRVTVTEEFDPGRCATISVFNTRQSLQLTFTDGRQVLVPTPTCSPITVAGREVDGGHLGDAFLAALDHQRDQLSYRRELTGALTCERGLVPTAARPGRERLLAAVRCDVTGSGESPTVIGSTLTDDEVSRLDAAWQQPVAVPEDPTATQDESDCTAPESRPSYLLAVTDRADVVRLTDTGCGFLVWDGQQPGEVQAIPTTLAELTP